MIEIEYDAHWRPPLTSTEGEGVNRTVVIRGGWIIRARTLNYVGSYGEPIKSGGIALDDWRGWPLLLGIAADLIRRTEEVCGRGSL